MVQDAIQERRNHGRLWNTVRIIARRPHYRTPRVQRAVPLEGWPTDFEELMWGIVMPIMIAAPMDFNRLSRIYAWQIIPVVMTGLAMAELAYFRPAETLEVILRLATLSRIGMGLGTRFARIAVAAMVILPAVANPFVDLDPDCTEGVSSLCVKAVCWYVVSIVSQTRLG